MQDVSQDWLDEVFGQQDAAQHELPDVREPGGHVQLDEGEDSDVQAPCVGTATERAPLPPGQKGKRFVFTMEKGREIEIDTLTGKSRFT